jgi:tRNA pseudouridine32 synthase / 23S rRNA pseudouridine746 synthase
MSNPSKYFIRFKSDISTIDLPNKFNCPFYYDVHPLCKLAVDELQDYLINNNQTGHDFGLDGFINKTNIGKMMGVLVVKTLAGDIGYLVAYSGKLSVKNENSIFVPPIVDLLSEDSFFKQEEIVINGINERINFIEQSEEYFIAKNELIKAQELSQSELDAFRTKMKSCKKQRDKIRAEFANKLSAEEFENLKEKLKNESLKLQYDYKMLSTYWKDKLSKISEDYNFFIDSVTQLKNERKKRSSSLQNRLFDEYKFLNIEGEIKSAKDIFVSTPQITPPSGAGDCAGPKLLQYAFQNNLIPLQMAEFWWGQSPRSEVRRHGNFYPACKSKCEPILGHMLKGMDVDNNPILNPSIFNVNIEIIYQDDDIVVINKPSEFLSVPGKNCSDSVLTRIKLLYPNATGPMIVHRLDMSTSGLMVVAKTKESYHKLQIQFLKRIVKKTYVAILDGVIEHDSGRIELPLRVDLDDRPRQLVCYEYGKPSITNWQKISIENGRTKVRFFPITGRTHQLRVHSAHSLGLNTPILGDDIYGQKNDRLHLHAESIEFFHPSNNQLMRFEVSSDF